MTDLAYAFEEGAGTTAAEILGGLELTGVPGWAAGRHGTAMYANGQLGPEWDPMSAAGDFTVMFDFYIVSNAGYTIFMSGGIGNPQIAPGGGAFEWYPFGINVAADQFPVATWRNMALVANGTARRVYLDGVLVGSAVTATPTGGDPIQLLGYPGLAPNARMDNLRFFDSALTVEEIADLAGTDVAGSEPPANLPPTANAGSNQSAFVGQQITLSGSGTDTDGTIASYSWTQTSGPAVVLGGAGATRTFTPTVAGSYVFALVVTDDDGAQSIPDSITVTISAIPQEPSSTVSTRAFGMIEKAVRQAIVAKMPDADGHVGGDLSYDVAEDDFYIWIGLIPGIGVDEIYGQWTVDIDVFARTYSQAMRRALDLEAIFVTRGGHRTPEMRIDNVYQNETPAERPWDDESSSRIGATYVFTARRPG
jgi:hypothetical protein